MTTAGRLATLRAALTGQLGVHDPRRPIGPDDLFPDDGGHRAPRIARFLARDGSARIGVVLESVEGLPRRILDLTARHGLGPGLLDFVHAGGIVVAEREIDAAGDMNGRDLVTLEREELPDRLLSPVDIDAAQIEAGTRLVVGFGLTFRRHREETGAAQPFAFPKPTVPTGACAPVTAGGDRGGPAVALLDYELELGCVNFRDVDLDRLDEVDAATDFGYLVVNDVSAREPILRDRRTGYAHAKGRPTYLPAGPWLIPGTHFTRDAPTLRRMVLTVMEAKAGPGRHGPHTLRQDARLEELSLGLAELLALLSRRRSITMRGADGRRWPITVERGGRRILPAGSLLLTGTPGGTAIRSPRAVDHAALVLRSLRYLRWPSEAYRQHLDDHRQAFGFLSTGDRVSGWITGLGRQEWQVV